MEVVRKDVQRAFGILKQRFRYLRMLMLKANADGIDDIVQASMVMHNMIFFTRVLMLLDKT
jgi:hypothetical protein